MPAINHSKVRQVLFKQRLHSIRLQRIAAALHGGRCSCAPCCRCWLRSPSVIVQTPSGQLMHEGILKNVRINNAQLPDRSLFNSCLRTQHMR
ncbi:hypothetical protein Pnap_3979 [Polaromonas naphthalenivorans CJ2]|uniref:Uncharacterized protein n=1 Tax=Polaromonas naphthalenivorans (strain CJ2) TaxID=365044 RepID=A1VUE6_POLNA|nr:hypothetical protein Pnap_3979 [Polaromonas naphthalenivorans CJ2]